LLPPPLLPLQATLLLPSSSPLVRLSSATKPRGRKKDKDKASAKAGGKRSDGSSTSRSTILHPSLLSAEFFVYWDNSTQVLAEGEGGKEGGGREEEKEEKEEGEMRPFDLVGSSSRYRRRLLSVSSSSSSSSSFSSSHSSLPQHAIQLLGDEDEDRREEGTEGWMRRALALQGPREDEGEDEARRADFLYWHRVLMATIKEEGEGGERREELREGGREGGRVGVHRRLLDTFGQSLSHVNRLYHKVGRNLSLPSLPSFLSPCFPPDLPPSLPPQAFGPDARKVPAHMPHMIDKGLVEEMQARWKQGEGGAEGGREERL